MAQREDIILEVKIDEGDAVESIDSIRKATRELTKERNAANLSTEEGQKQVQALNKQIDANNARIKANIDALNKQRLNVGNYSKSIQDAAGKIGIFNSGLGNSFSQLQNVTGAAKSFIATPLGAVIAVIGAAFAAAAAAIQKSEKALDFIEDITTKVTAAFNVLVNRIAGLIDGTRSLANLFTDVGEEIQQAANQAILYNNVLRDLEDAQFKFRLENAATERQIKALVIAAKNRNLTFQEQEELLNKALDLERNLVKERTELARIEAVAITKQVALEKSLRQTSDETFDAFVKRVTTSGKLSKDENEKIVAAIEKLENARSSSLAFEEKVQNQLEAINQRRIAETEKEIAFREKLIESVNKQKGGELRKVQVDEAKFTLDVNQRLSEDLIKLNQKTLETTTEQKAEQNRIKLELDQQEIESSKQVALATAQIFSILSGEAKAFALTQIGISTGEAIAKGISASQSVPFPGNLAAIATTIAAVLTNIAAAKGIVSAAAGGGEFMTRGPALLLVGDNPGGVEKVTVEPRSGRGKTRVAKGGNLVAMAGGGSITSVPDGTTVANSLTNDAGAMMAVLNAIRNMPAPEVSVKEVTKTQNRIRVKENVSRL